MRSPPQGGSTHAQGSRGFTLPVGHTKKFVTLSLPQSGEENINMKTPPARPPCRPVETKDIPPPDLPHAAGWWDDGEIMSFPPAHKHAGGGRERVLEPHELEAH